MEAKKIIKILLISIILTSCSIKADKFHGLKPIDPHKCYYKEAHQGKKSILCCVCLGKKPIEVKFKSKYWQGRKQYDEVFH